MMIDKNLLLPREKYAEVSKQYGKSPFTFEIEKDGQVLFYFGANHSTDPENHQFPILREYWKRFLEKTEGNEKIVLIEGGLRPLGNSEKEAIEKSSEGGLATYLAHKENIPIASPDISPDDFAEKMDLDKKQWFLASFLRWFESFQRNKKVKEDTLEEICEIIKRKDYWKDVEVTPEKFKTLYKQYVGKDFNENESQNDLVNPNRDDAVTNKLIRLHSDAREIKIVEDIEKYWKEGKSVFIVFGSGHLIIQRPAIEAMLK